MKTTPKVIKHFVNGREVVDWVRNNLTYSPGPEQKGVDARLKIEAENAMPTRAPAVTNKVIHRSGKSDTRRTVREESVDNVIERADDIAPSVSK